MCKFTKSYDERYDRIMNEPIWPSRLMFNASMMYRKSVEDGDKLIVLGWWSVTTSRHINYAASQLGLTKIDKL